MSEPAGTVARIREDIQSERTTGEMFIANYARWVEELGAVDVSTDQHVFTDLARLAATHLRSGHLEVGRSLLALATDGIHRQDRLVKAGLIQISPRTNRVKPGTKQAGQT